MASDGPDILPHQYAARHRAWQRLWLDSRLNEARRNMGAVALEATALDEASPEYDTKMMWVSGWGEILRSLEGLLRISDCLVRNDPTTSGETLQRLLSLVTGVDGILEAMHNAVALDFELTIPLAKKEGFDERAAMARAAKGSKLAKRREIVDSIVAAIPAGTYLSREGNRIARDIMPKVNQQLLALGLNPVKQNSIYRDVINSPAFRPAPRSALAGSAPSPPRSTGTTHS